MTAQSTISGIMDQVLTELRSLAYQTGFPELNIYGPRDDAANSSPPGLWWFPGNEKWGPGERFGQAGTPSALWTRNIPIHLALFGGENDDRKADDEGPSTGAGTFFRDTDQTEALIELVVNAFHRRSSQFSYQVVDGGWGKSARTGIGIAYDMIVELRLPLVRIDNPTVKLTGIRLNRVDFNVEVNNG
jgi:hypothetical protein